MPFKFYFPSFPVLWIEKLLFSKIIISFFRVAISDIFWIAICYILVIISLQMTSLLSYDLLKCRYISSCWVGSILRCVCRISPLPPRSDYLPCALTTVIDGRISSLGGGKGCSCLCNHQEAVQVTWDRTGHNLGHHLPLLSEGTL